MKSIGFLGLGVCLALLFAGQVQGHPYNGGFRQVVPFVNYSRVHGYHAGYGFPVYGAYSSFAGYYGAPYALQQLAIAPCYTPPATVSVPAATVTETYQPPPVTVTFTIPSPVVTRVRQLAPPCDNGVTLQGQTYNGAAYGASDCGASAYGATSYAGGYNAYPRSTYLQALAPYANFVSYGNQFFRSAYFRNRYPHGLDHRFAGAAFRGVTPALRSMGALANRFVNRGATTIVTRRRR